MGRSDRNYLLKDELEFIKGLGKNIWYDKKETLNRFHFLQKYLKTLDLRQMDNREHVEKFIAEEIVICDSQNCDKNRITSKDCSECWI